MPIYFASVRSRRQALLRVTNEWPLVAPSEFRRGRAAAFPVASIRACDPARNGLVRHWLPFARSGNDRSGAHRYRCGRSSAAHPSTWLNGVALCIKAYSKIGCQCPSQVKPGLPPWGPHVRFRRVQTIRRAVRWSSCAILLSCRCGRSQSQSPRVRLTHLSS
jgi:hypothetical protein